MPDPVYQSGGSFDPFSPVRFQREVDFAGTSNQTSQNIGSSTTSGVSIVEQGNGAFHRTVITLSGVAVAVSDTNVGGGTLVYTFPQGIIGILGGQATIAETTTSVLATTLKASKTLSVGVGSVQTTTQASGTLVTTEQDIVNAFTTTSSATINVPGTATSGYLSATTSLKYDGHTTNTKAYINIGVPTATDIDGDATTTVSGQIVIVWYFVVDY